MGSRFYLAVPSNVRALFDPADQIMPCPFRTRRGRIRRQVFDNPAERAWRQMHLDVQR
jgi:hypothetical protein